MIAFKNLHFEFKEVVFEHLNLDIHNGEIFFLISKDDRYNQLLMDMFLGLRVVNQGSISLDDKMVNFNKRVPVSLVSRIDDVADYDTDIRLKDFADFFIQLSRTNKNIFLEILINFDLFERDLRKKIKAAEPWEFKAVYLALCLAANHDNIVINDFIRGEEKDFELKFNRLLIDLKKRGKTILYLTSDIFYAYQIADRLSFFKNGYILPANPIIASDLKEMDLMILYKRYLSAHQ